MITFNNLNLFFIYKVSLFVYKSIFRMQMEPRGIFVIVDVLDHNSTF